LSLRMKRKKRKRRATLEYLNKEEEIVQQSKFLSGANKVWK